MLESLLSNVATTFIFSRYFLYILLSTFVLWVLYVSIMTLQKRKKRLVQGLLFYLLLPVGFLVDVAYNITIGSLIFWELPKEATLSQRLARYVKGGAAVYGFRTGLAVKICKRLIEPWDQGHCHLDKLP